MRRRHSPVQQWVDSIPSPTRSNLKVSNQVQEPAIGKPKISVTPTEPQDIPYSAGTKCPSMTVSAPVNVPATPRIITTGLASSLPHNRLARDPSLQSDSSHCSSVESLLELRRADPEAILLGLGFGGCSNTPQDNGPLSRIPKRFLQPSKLKGIAINDFVKHQQETSESFDSVSLGYRGLTGSPYIAPSEIVQKIMDRLRENESHDMDPYIQNYYESYSPLQYNGMQSVLSPDNRQFLERPRSKSPDMRNKRMIIGQKSFAFGHDGDLIEIEPLKTKDTSPDYNSNKSFDANEDQEESLDTDTEDGHTSGKQLNHNIIERIPKKLLFDDSFEFDESGKGLTTCGSNIDIDNPSCSRKQLNTVLLESSSDTKNKGNISCDDNPSVPKYCQDTRRGSEGSYDVKSEIIPGSEGRRHSDSTVHDIENSSESLLSQKRKMLKRQSKICDGDPPEYCESSESCEVAGSSMQSHCQENDNLSSMHDAECSYTKSTAAAAAAALYRGNDQRFCRTVPDETDEEHERNCTDCCCHIDKSKYWKEMRKIMRENKKLGSLVAKNNREMAEIREMLSNVLSVRMEPGF